MMISKFGQIVHIRSDRGNRQAVLNLAAIDNSGPTLPNQIWSGTGFRPNEMAQGQPMEIVKLSNEDAFSFLHNTYGITPAVITPFMKDWDLNKLYLASQFDPGCRQFFQDIMTYMTNPSSTDPVKTKVFQYLQHVRQTGGKDVMGQPIVSVVV